MLITCYAFSNRTLQIGHTYYSIGMGAEFYFELETYEGFCYFDRPFIYEVKIDTDRILYCDNESIRSIEYKISREVRFEEYITKFNYLSKNELRELLNILNGNISKKEAIAIYTSIINKDIKDIYKVTRFEQLEFFAILNQAKYELPKVELEKRFQIDYYIRLLTYYNKPYNVACSDSTKITDFRRELIKQKIMGASEFEVISDKTPEKFAYNYFLADYILNRQITQEQFEKLCSLYKRDILTFNFRVKSAAILAGYKILPEYRKLFYPFVLYHGVENCLDLIDKESKSSEPLYALFYCGYKFKNFDYSSMPWNKEVAEAKTIFQNGFKYIE